MIELEVTGIQEVVIAVKNAQQAVALFEDLFGLKFDIQWTMPSEDMNVKAAMIGETQLHIVESTKTDGVIGKFIQNHGQGIHHIAFKVTNLEKWVARLKEKGITLIPEKP